MNIAFVGSELFVRLDDTEGPCHKFVSVGGANLSVLKNASLTCGPPGEWKKRVAEELHVVFFQGGLDWVKSDNDTIEVATEDGNFTTTVSEAKYAAMSECWAKACGCEQANNPKAKVVLLSLLIIALGGLSWDSIKLALESIRGKKPDDKLLCKGGHKIMSVKSLPKPRASTQGRICDECGKSRDIAFRCEAQDYCTYDLCKACHKDLKKDLRKQWEEWCKKHPQDTMPEALKRKSKTAKGDDDDAEDDDKKDASGSEAGGEKKGSEPDSDTKEDSQAGDEKSEKSEATTAENGTAPTTENAPAAEE